MSSTWATLFSRLEFLISPNFGAQTPCPFCSHRQSSPISIVTERPRSQLLSSWRPSSHDTEHLQQRSLTLPSSGLSTDSPSPPGFVSPVRSGQKFKAGSPDSTGGETDSTSSDLPPSRTPSPSLRGFTSASSGQVDRDGSGSRERSTVCTCGKHDTFRNCMECFLRDDIGNTVSMFTEENGCIRFGELFYQRMSSTNDVLSTTQTEGYTRCLREYLASLSEAELHSEAVLVERARQLLDYLITHAQDPDQSLIGLSPSKTLLAPVVASFEVILAHLEKQQRPVRIVPFRRGIQQDAGLLKREGSSFPHRKNVVDLVLDWSAQLTAEQRPVDELMAAINESVALITAERQIWNLSMSRSEHLRPGTLVVVGLTHAEAAAVLAETGRSRPQAAVTSILSTFPRQIELPPGPRYCYRLARFAGETDDGDCLVYVCPQEISAVAVSWRQIIDLPKESLAALGSMRAMRQLSMDPIDALYSEFSLYAREATHDFIAARGVSLDLLQKALDNICNITDLGNLKHLLSLLDRMLDESTDEFGNCARQIQAETCKHQAAWAESYSRLDIFVPTREYRLNELLQTDFGQASRDRLKRYKAVIEAALGQLQLQKRSLMNGSQKQQMTDWWLSLIEARVKAFLDKIGYIAGAVNDDYIATPPASLADIKTNLRIVREILDPKRDVHAVKQFVKQLKDEIYPRIHEFFANGRVTLSEHFNVDEHSFDLAVIKQMFKNKTPPEKFTDPKIVEWVDDMIKDMEYVEAINAAELAVETGAANGNKGLELGPVPISGLILGCFFRLENELLTVLDCWDHEANEAATSEQDQENTDPPSDP